MKKYKTALLVIDLQKDFTMSWGSVYRDPTGEMMQRVGENIDKFREKGILIVIVYSGGPKDKTSAGKKINLNPQLSRMYKQDGSRKCLVEGTPGFEIDDRIHYNKDTDIMWRKKAASAFFKTDLDEVLTNKGVENVLICGVKTNVCCRASANDAYSHGFKTYVISDMTATNTQELNEFFLSDMSKYFATAISSEEVFSRIEKGEF